MSHHNDPGPEAPFIVEDPGYDPVDFDIEPPTEAFDFHEVERPNPVNALRRTVKDAALAVLAACHGRPASEVAELVALLRSGTTALEVLDDEGRETLLGAAECLGYEAAENTSVVRLDRLPAADVYDDRVRALLARALVVDDEAGANATATWMAALEAVARHRSASRGRELLGLIDTRARTEVIVEAHQRLADTPPTARKSLSRTAAVASAAAVADAEAAARAASAPVRFSSGYRTLDIWMTNAQSGEPMGFIAPGEGIVIAAGTGQGKSSFSYRLVPALAQDLHNWGRREAKVYFAHTEEASADKVEFMELGPGQRYHHLAQSVMVANVGSSREAFVMGLYDLVIDAHTASRETGRPVTDFLPEVVVLDYIQSLSGEGESDIVTSTYRTAELILRGIQAWNPTEMAKWSGVDFTTYAGMSWPSGMEHHKVATVVFAQLVKAAGASGPYRPGARGVQLSDYTVLDSNGEPLWNPREGDQPVLGKSAIFGSSIILNNATSIVFLHRSNIHAGRSTGADGRAHLDDTRARLIIDKMRNSAKSPVVPMAFDSQPNGKRGQYYDPAAEQALTEGRFTPDASWLASGDPILPVRPATKPLAGFAY